MKERGKKQAFNPYLPSYEYVPDAEPHIVGDRLYIYGSHDLFNGLTFCLGDYVCWSAPLDDLANWRYEGVIYERKQEPHVHGSRLLLGMAAPDMAQGADGRFYLYYFVGGTKKISVAVCDTPAGKYQFYGHVRYEDGTPIGMRGEPYQFDPGIFRDDDGRVYLYTGFGLKSNPILLMGAKPTVQGPMVFELDARDMLTVRRGPSYIGVPSEDGAKGTPYEGHAFLEASSMRKFDGRYYYIYSSMLSHELCYAVSAHPTHGFTYGGTLVSNGDIGLPRVRDVRHARNDTGNTHGSLIQIHDRYYVFYHRHSNRKQSSRQACAEQITFRDGRFEQAQMTSCGLNGQPLAGYGVYSSYIACNLHGRRQTRFLSMIKRPKWAAPYLTQDGGDRESGADQYIAYVGDGACITYKYFDLEETTKIGIRIRGNAQGVVTVRAGEQGQELANIPIVPTGKQSVFRAPLHGGAKKSALTFTFSGRGHFAFYAFMLK